MSSRVETFGFRNLHYDFREDDLPDRLADLSPEQIAELFYKPPKVRWRYTKYFTGVGHLRADFYDIIFERLPFGELRHPRSILASNMQNWEGKLRNFEQPEEFNADRSRRTKCPSMFRNRRADDGLFRSRRLDEVPEISRAARAVADEAAERENLRDAERLLKTVAEEIQARSSASTGTNERYQTIVSLLALDLDRLLKEPSTASSFPIKSFLIWVNLFEGEPLNQSPMLSPDLRKKIRKIRQLLKIILAQIEALGTSA